MALKFNCGNCGAEIVVKYVGKGEKAKCRLCGTETVVPESATATEEEPDIVRRARERREGPPVEKRPNDNPFPLVPFSSGHSRARMLIFVLVVAMLLAAISVGSTYSQIRLVHKVLDEGGVTVEEAEANSTRQETVFALKIGVLLAIVVFLPIWAHRAYRNLPSLGIRGLRFTPGQVVRAWFGKIVSLYRPCQIITEIWKASDPKIDLSDHLVWQRSRSWVVIGWWWFLWIITVPVNILTFGATFEAKTLEGLLATSWVVLISEIAFIVTCNLLVLIVRTIDSRQEDKHNELRRQGISIAQP